MQVCYFRDLKMLKRSYFNVFIVISSKNIEEPLKELFIKRYFTFDLSSSYLY